jgi:BON domain
LRLLTFILLTTFIWTARPIFAATVTNGQAAAGQSIIHSDAEIERAIQAKLAKSKIGKDNFTFHVSRGVVTWEGNTSVMQHKGAATRMAKSSGAAKVVNNIQVSAAAKQKATQGLRKASVVAN